MPETSVIVGASLAIHFFTPRPATGGRAEEGLGHRGEAKRRAGASQQNSGPLPLFPRGVASIIAAQDRGAGKRKAGPPWRGGYRQARLNDKIVTHCNTLTNLCICCK
jgi:hypothetical protein